MPAFIDIKKDITTFTTELANGQHKCTDLVQSYLEQIDQNSHLNAYITVFADQALEQAKDVDKKIASGNAGSLAGCVLAVKDLIAMQGAPTTCGSKILSNFMPPYNAFIIDKLRAQDAIFIGKTNMDEFAMGSSNENSYFGPTLNPNDTDRVPGGSSGGSATAVKANLCMAAVGSDTGGSIRQPASFCGVVGLKPTYGRVSRFGLVAFASSLDQIGPITKSVPDSALLLNTLAGYDNRDSTCANRPVEDYTSFLGKDVKGLKIGLPKEYFAKSLDPEVEQPIRNAVDALENAGAHVLDVSLPHMEYAINAYYIIAPAEASANLARYDGARYGVRAEEVQDLEEMYINSRTQGFGEEVKRRIMLGTYVLSSGYYEAYYLKAQKVRTLVKKDFDNVFEKVDVLCGPVAPTTAFKIGEKIDDPLTMYLTDIYTVSVNLAGLPGISVPCGTDSNGLPVGLQIIGKAFDEGKILQVADFWERSHTTK